MAKELKLEVACFESAKSCDLTVKVGAELLKKTNISLVIASAGSLSSPKSFSFYSRLSAQSQKKFTETFKAEDKAKPVDLKKGKMLVHPAKAFKSASFAVSNEETLYVFELTPKFETYFLHEALREFLGGLFSKADYQSLNIMFNQVNELSQQTCIEALLLLQGLSIYQIPQYGLKAAEKTSKKEVKWAIECDLSIDEISLLVERAKIECGAMNLQRALSETPSNYLRPSHYREKIQKLAKQHSLEYKFLDKAALKRMGAGAFLAVIQADPDSQAGIAHLVYKPAKKAPGKSTQRLAYVGKGLCFDTGGYDIKVGGGMATMHRDMAGSAVALAATIASSQMKVDYEVHCFLAIAENLISETGYHVNDVVTAMNGISIEVVDTDAEGRMVLSDTLSYARTFAPDVCIDFATLTGSCIRAMDTRRSTVYSNRSEMLTQAVAVGDTIGERVWGFPCADDYMTTLKSDVADIAQCSSGKNSDHIYAATFLRHFIGEETKWLHVDLAAEGNSGGLGLTSSESTGFGVRFALAMAKRALS